MRALFAIPLVLTVLSTTSPARADDEPDCSDPQTTVEMNFCSDAAFRDADKRLNAAYQDALRTVSERDLDAPYDRKSWEEALRASQRAWVAYRDADCKGAVPMEWSGGTGTTSAVTGCMTDKTETRIKDLEERYGEK